MEHAIQRDLVVRVLEHLAHRTTDTEERPTLQPVATYFDEAKPLFRELPLIVGHASHLAGPGSFFTHDASGVPLLIVRDDDGRVGAFLNVCRHRGTRVERAPCGGKQAFVCPYHAWSYGRDGALLGMPHERGFDGIAREERGLVRVPCVEYAGFIFVRPAPNTSAEALGASDRRSAPHDRDALSYRGIDRNAPSHRATEHDTLDARPRQAIEHGTLDARSRQASERGTLDAAAWLGPIADDLLGFGLATSHAYAPYVRAKAMSWQLAIDVFLESYHLRPTHKDSIYPLFFDNLGLVDPIGPHLRNIFPKRTIRELAAMPPDTWQLRRHANVLYHLFPNTLILVEPDHAAVLHLWPQGPDRVLLTAYTLVPEAPATDKARAYWDANNAILYNAIEEDFAMGESIQAGLASGANREVVYGAFEHALAHFHRQIARYAH